MLIVRELTGRIYSVNRGAFHFERTGFEKA